MKKVWIDPGCTTCGLCEFLAPEVFTVSDISHVKDDAPLKAAQENIKDAASQCPVQVIKWQE